MLEAKAYQDAFRDYLGALRQLHALGASTAGYIDKPRGDLLIRLLEHFANGRLSASAAMDDCERNVLLLMVMIVDFF